MDAIKLSCRLLLLLGWWALPVQATVLFVVPSYAPQVMSLVNATNQQLQHDFEIRLPEEATGLDSRYYRAIVLVGAQVLEQWQPLAVPTVAVLSSRQQVEAAKQPLVSAIYAEPSLQQQLLLAQAMIGKGGTLGVLLQEHGGADYAWLQHQSTVKNPIVIASVQEQGSLNAALRVLTDKSAILVGVYDLDLYNNDNLKNILVTAYRNNQVLVGPSVAYVRAGAAASVYSDVQEVSTRLVEVLQQGMQQGRWPEADYSPYFKVSINQQVARSLSLDLPDEAVLIHSIQAASGGE